MNPARPAPSTPRSSDPQAGTAGRRRVDPAPDGLPRAMPGAAGSLAYILTPEHVPVVLRTAGLGSRFLALLVDLILLLAVTSMINGVLLAALPMGIGIAAGATCGFVLNWGYPVFFEVTRQGRTPGKMLLKLRVVDARGLAITPQQSFIRNIVRALDFFPLFYGLGTLVALFDRHHRRLGDIVADTLVIDEDQPAELTGHLAEERRYNSLRTPQMLRRIRNRISLEERELLVALALRAPRMKEQARYDLMEEVGGYFRRELALEDDHLSGENIVRGLASLLVRPHPR